MIMLSLPFFFVFILFLIVHFFPSCHFKPGGCRVKNPGRIKLPDLSRLPAI